MKRYFSVNLLFLAIITLLLSACEKSSPTDVKKQLTYVTGQWERITDSLLDDPQLPGLIIGIWVPEKNVEWVRAKGYSDRQSWEAPDPNMAFRIGNITESFSSTLILQLIDEGKISLDDSLSKYLPDYPKADSVKIHMLLNHASGIPDYLASGLASQAYKHPERIWSRDELIDFAKTRPYYFTPGSDYQYSATNALIAAEVVEKVTGNTFQEELKDRILDTLGLTNTFYPSGPATESSFFRGYTLEEDKVTDVTEVIHPSFYREAAGMVSNLYDLRTWIENLYQGTLLTADTREKMHTLINAPGTVFQQNGLGIMYSSNPPVWGHSGSIYGYATLAIYAPELNLTMVIAFNNTRKKPMDLARRLLSIYMQNVNN